MKYEQIAPPAYLEDHVRYFWTMEGSQDSLLPVTFRPTADGCPGILLRQPEAGILTRDEKVLPKIFVYGQTTSHTEIITTGKFHVMGIVFYPGALKSVFGIHADELTNTCADLYSMSDNTQEFSLSAQLSDQLSEAGQIQILSRWLYAQIGKNNIRQDTATEYAIARIVGVQGNIALKELQKDMQLSERTFERRFRQSVGISPKLFSRICRFQAALEQMKSSGYERLSDIAYENEYADQSHFIRAFKEFSGSSPYKYQKQSGELAANFLQLIS